MKLFLSVLIYLVSISSTLLAQENVDAYGAAGDGVTDDFDAILAAIQAAGEGGTVVFNPSKTYLSCKVLKPLRNQKFDFQGATLKRCDEVVADVSSYDGNGVWEVSDASGFEVGMWISVSSTGGYDVTTGPMEIRAIDGNTITSWLSIQEPLAGAKMSSDSPFFHIVEQGVSIMNFNFDGNYPNNGSILKWDTSILMLLSGNNTTIKDGVVTSIPGDFVRFADGSDGSSISNVEARDGAGVFAHLSGIGLNGTQGISLINNTIADLGKEFQRQEHAFGAIEWSFDVGNVNLIGNTFEDLPFAAINMTSDPRAEKVLIRDNSATNTEGFIIFWKNEIDSDPSSSQATEIIGNRLMNTKENIIFVGDIDEPISEVDIFNNVGENTFWNIKGIADLEYRNNDMIVDDYDAAGTGAEFDFFFSPAILQLRSVGNGVIEDNYFEGNWRQLSFENRGIDDGYDFEDNYTISNNQFRDFVYSGIQGRADANVVGGFNEVVNWSSNDNVLKSSVLGEGVDISPSGKAVVFSSGGVHDNNCVLVTSSKDDTFAAEIYGLASAGGFGEGGKFTNNVFANPSGLSTQWGRYDQVHSINSENSVVTDNISIAFVNANSGFETGTLVDARAVCDPPGRTFLSIPSDNADNVMPTAKFTWRAADLASGYQIQISKDQLFSDLAIDSLTADTTEIELGPLDLSTKYYWRTRSINNRGSSDWTDVRAFSVVTNPLPTSVSLKGPVSGSSGRDLPVEIEWIAADFVDLYHLQVALDSAFSQIKFNNDEISETAFLLDSNVLEDSTSYYWRVRGQNAQGNSPSWSEVWSFTTTAIGVLPSIVDLAEPMNNSIGQDEDLTLRWRIAGNTSTYKFQLSDDENFSNIIHDVTVADTLYNPTGVEMDRDYWWRIRGESSQGLSPDWSEVWKFSTSGGLPSNISLLSPADGTTEVSTDVLLQWGQDLNSSSYHLQLADDNAFSNVVQDLTIPTDSSFTLSGLAQNTVYWWRVRGVNSQGESPSWSPEWMFTTVTGVSNENEFPGETEIQIYPNPVSNRVFISLGENSIQDIRVYNALGRVVRTIQVSPNQATLEIDLGSIARGAYFIEVQHETGESRIFPISVIR